jgi:TolB protein
MTAATRINARASRALTAVTVVLVCLATCAGAPNDAGAWAGRSGHASSQPVRNGLIAFDRVGGIFVMTPNGRNVRQLTRPPHGVVDQVPRWSPDGQRVLFERHAHEDMPDESVHLYVINKDGTGLTNLTTDCSFPCLGTGEGDWSPDGKQIVMERALGPIPDDGPPAVFGLFIMRADGSDVRQITQLTPNSGSEDHKVSWSPDGKRIAFMRSVNVGPDTNASAIYVFDVDGSDLHLVRKMPARRSGSGSPRWSPDGKTILFGTMCVYGGACTAPPTGAQLFTMRPDGSHVRQITHLPGNSYNGAWSPDGKKIAFARHARRSPTGDIWTMNANGTGLRQLTNAPSLDSHHPDWQRRP